MYYIFSTIIICKSFKKYVTNSKTPNIFTNFKICLVGNFWVKSENMSRENKTNGSPMIITFYINNGDRVHFCNGGTTTKIFFL
jgi:hypothetical protein